MPPKIENCILSPGGGGACIEADGTQVFKLPSQLVNYWCTSEPDMKNFASWCYDTSAEATAIGMAKIKESLK